MSSKSSDPERGGPRERRAAASKSRVVPIALIAQRGEVLFDLERRLRSLGTLVRFASVAQFCEQGTGERYAALIVARACTFDARLDAHVVSRDRIALWGLGLLRTWPAGVQRLESEADVTRFLVGIVPHRTPASAPPTQRSTDKRGPGKLLVVGESDEPTHGLLASLRRVREVRRVLDFGDLPEAWRDADEWTAVIALHTAPHGLEALARHEQTAAVFRPRGPTALRTLDDDSDLAGFLAFAIAFEHTGQRATAEAVAAMVREFDLRGGQAELLAVALRSEHASERARLLGTGEANLHALLRELKARARGLSLDALVMRLPKAPRGAPPRFAPRAGTRRAPLETFADLADRVPAPWHGVSILALPELPEERSLLLAARRAGARTVADLAALPAEHVPPAWRRGLRSLRAFEEQLHTAPGRPVEGKNSVLGTLDGLVARLPGRLSGLVSTLLADEPVLADVLRARGLTRQGLVDAVCAACLRLDFEASSLRAACQTIAERVQEAGPIPLARLASDDHLFSGVDTRPEALSFVLWLVREHRIALLSTGGVAHVVRADANAPAPSEPTLEKPRPWRHPANDERDPVRLDATLARAIASCLGPRPKQSHWHDLGEALDPALHDTSPEEVLLPVALRSFARRMGIRSLGVLFAHPALSTLELDHALLYDTARALRLGTPDDLRDLVQSRSLLEAFERRTASLASSARDLVALRAGLRGAPGGGGAPPPPRPPPAAPGEPETPEGSPASRASSARDRGARRAGVRGAPVGLRALAEQRRTTQGALRQIEKRAMQTVLSAGWGDAVRIRVHRAWFGTWSLTGMAQESWLRGVDSAPARHVLTYLCEWLFEAEERLSPVVLDGLVHLTSRDPAEVARLYGQVVDALRASSGPPRAEVVHETVARLVPDPDLARQLIDRLRIAPAG